MKNNIEKVVPLGNPAFLKLLGEKLNSGVKIKIIIHNNFPLAVAKVVSENHPNLEVYYHPKRHDFLYMITDKKHVFFVKILGSNKVLATAIFYSIIWSRKLRKLFFKIQLPESIKVLPTKALKLNKLIKGGVEVKNILKFLTA